VPDQAFDAWLPNQWRHHSSVYWTRVAVATQVARWLAERSVRRVLDVGSGVGKFCVVGALASGARFEGVEHRPHLVEAARHLAARFGVEGQTSFGCQTLEALDTDLFGALYFYNPFEENMLLPSHWIDRAVELGLAQFRRDTLAAELLLHRLRVGTYLVTCAGYGGRLPDCFELETCATAGRSLLRLWRKVRESAGTSYWFELEDATVLQKF
jgi:SAM-dependent methyltransferase